MSASLVVKGFAPPDEAWRKHKAIWDACNAAGIEPPPAVDRFFDYQQPDEAGVEIDVPIRPWRSDYAEGGEIDIADIPANAKTIRVYISW